MTSPFIVTLRAWLVDTRERVFSTFVAALAVWIVALDRVEPGAHWLRGLVAATIPPVLVVVFQMVPQLVYTGPVWWIDAAVRIARSALQGFLGALIAGGVDLLSVPTYKAAAVAAGMAAWATVKVIVARWRPGTISPASFARR